MPSATPPTISTFRPLAGGFRQAIAPDGRRIVTLHRGAAATWWEGDTPVTAELPPGTPVDGARWTADGTSLHVGLGVLDLDARTWRADPTLATWGRPGPRGESPVKGVAWSADASHVVLLLESRAPDGARSTEVVVVFAADGSARGRRTIPGAKKIAASDQRVLVAARTPAVLDLDGAVVAEPAPLPPSVTRVREGAAMFAAIGAAGAVALVRPADGAVLATWEIKAVDAVPLPGGVAAVDLEGTVRIGCLEGGAIREVADADSGVKNAVIQHLGGRLVVAGAGADPVRVATFANPCS
jgi:hypothetical protein